ncbi:hypothetical protein BZL30_0862 [Mycobacterium kansasii]|uniref:Uncharacterized protein n=1 Tax=Mycobacterium kansasii TaxID=1768 RepID=A0A1V3XSH9_MYCKA|nr:hypothetical protein BZL30_0862 [Mycobacterium kansasii]
MDEIQVADDSFGVRLRSDRLVGTAPDWRVAHRSQPLIARHGKRVGSLSAACAPSLTTVTERYVVTWGDRRAEDFLL